MSAAPSFSKIGQAATQSDNRAFSFSPEEIAFFKTLTKIDDEKQLRDHIIDVQKGAFEIMNYYCIQNFSFVKLSITRQPGYQQAINLRQLQKDPILLDIGCCFGTDVRKAIFDGWPEQYVIASDIHGEFWDYGHKLFVSDPKSFPVKFIAGDVLDPSTLQPRGPFIDDKEIVAILKDPVPPLSDVQSLTPLHGKISAIYAGSLFHLFTEEEQLTLARSLASLLRPEKGSVIFGQHLGRKEKGTGLPYIGRLASFATPFCHSPQSWTDIWETHVFGGNDKEGNNRIKVDVEFIDVDWIDAKGVFEKVNPDEKYYMQWCITHL